MLAYPPPPPILFILTTTINLIVCKTSLKCISGSIRESLVVKYNNNEGFAKEAVCVPVL